MTMGSEANNAYTPTCELRKWQRTPDGYIGIAYNDVHKIMEDGQTHMVLATAIKREHNREDHLLVVTMGWKFKLLYTEEVHPK